MKKVVVLMIMLLAGLYACAQNTFKYPLIVGTNGGAGGQITLRGSTSGSAVFNVPAAAGTTTFTFPTTNGTTGQVLTTNGAGILSWGDGGTGGSMVYPAGSGIPIVVGGTSWGTTITDNSANWNTAYGWGNHASAGYYVGTSSTIRGLFSSTATGLTYSGTGIFSLTSGYVIPTTTNASNWSTAYGWGNHASAGYAPLASPTFTGTVTLPSTTSIGNVSSTEIGYVDGLTGSAASRQDINDTIDVYIAGAELGLKVADSTGYAVGNYVTHTQLTDATSGAGEKRDDLLQGLRAMGNSIIAFPMAMSSIGSSSYTMADGNAFFLAFILHEAATITGVAFINAQQGVFTAADFNGVAIYSVNENTATRVAISANDGDIWKGTAYTKISVPLTSTYNAAAGIYYVGIMYNQSAQTTGPSVYCSVDIVTANPQMDRLNRRIVALSPRTQFETTETISGLSFTAKVPMIWLY